MEKVIKKNIAIVGATGIVGRKVLKILTEKNLGCHNYFLFASISSAGKKLSCCHKIKIVQTATLPNILQTNPDIVMLCTKENVSKELVPALLQKDIYCIDFSSHYRHTYQLIVPEINKINKKEKLICNPNCSTIAACTALNLISKNLGLKNIVYSTYQAVSGAGKLALQDFYVKDKSKLKKLCYPINNNLIPIIGSLDPSGISTEENKMIYETKKILDDDKIKIAATCVRVPVKVSHSISIHFQTKKAASLSIIKHLLKITPGVIIAKNGLPMPLFTSEQDKVVVGRIRQSYQKNTFDIFVCSDNLRKGAAQNGVQILEQLL